MYGGRAEAGKMALFEAYGNRRIAWAAPGCGWRWWVSREHVLAGETLIAKDSEYLEADAQRKLMSLT